jgi:hypothetical protein
MNLQRHKLKLAAAVAVAALAAIILLTIDHSTNSPSFTLLYITNNPDGGKLGVFHLENLSDEFVIKSYFYLRTDTPAPPIPATHLNLGTTDILQFALPTNTGPYKLVLLVFPARGSSPQLYYKFRFAVQRLVWPLLHPSATTQARRSGYFFVESQPFEVTP